MQAANSEDELVGVAVELHNDGRYRFDWGPAFSQSPLTIYAGATPTGIDRARPLLREARPGATVAALHPGQREYFLLERGDGSGLVVAQRNVPLTGSINFRDLGGYASADGRRVQWGRLFRSGHMANLGADSVPLFTSLDIHTVCDFRTTEERASEARGLPGEPRLEVLEITPGIGDRYFFNRLFASTDDPQKVVDAMHEMMRVLVLTAAPRYQRLFEVLLEGAPGAVLINCSAGKERTGVAAALLLTALGVPRATILADFLLSQRYFPYESEIPRVITKYDVKASGAAARQLIMPLLETRESYLQSAFAAIDERYGSGEGLLKTLYGLGPAELARLRSHYTS
jgi:protein-tyrosine phosphatase